MAVNDDEVQRLRALYVRALSNNVEDIRLISGDELRTIEPHCRVIETHQSKNYYL